jgi:hypothetical protein
MVMLKRVLRWTGIVLLVVLLSAAGFVFAQASAFCGCVSVARRLSARAACG